MSRHRAIAIAVLAYAPACSGDGASRAAESSRAGRSTQAIEDGTVDTTHTFTVAVVQASNQSALVLCSGALLAPNLVVTARHCVVGNPPASVDCATSTFGPALPATDSYVTDDAQVDPSSNHFVGVDQVLVPAGSGHEAVCGNDIALLVLHTAITLPQYVVPVTDPPLTDSSVYAPVVTAIGYGFDGPGDVDGATSGMRRIKQEIALACIPNDPSFVDCFDDPVFSALLTAGEFLSGDASTCDGDSGSSAFDQASFDRGEWVSYGVLSRGTVNADGTACVLPIYTRFDAWSAWLAAGAEQAAAAGGYPAPTWATSTTVGAEASDTEDEGAPEGADAGLASDAVAGEGASPAEASPEEAADAGENDAPGSPGQGGCSAGPAPARTPPAGAEVVAFALGVTAWRRRRRWALR